MAKSEPKSLSFNSNTCAPFCFITLQVIMVWITQRKSYLAPEYIWWGLMVIHNTTNQHTHKTQTTTAVLSQWTKALATEVREQQRQVLFATLSLSTLLWKPCPPLLNLPSPASALGPQKKSDRHRTRLPGHRLSHSASCVYNTPALSLHKVVRRMSQRNQTLLSSHFPSPSVLKWCFIFPLDCELLEGRN